MFQTQTPTKGDRAVTFKHHASMGGATFPALLLVLFLSAIPPRASAQNVPAPGNGWYICAFNTYISDMFVAPDGTDSFRAMTSEFRQFVVSKYGRQQHAVSTCSRFLSQRLAENALTDYKIRTYNDGSKSIMTGWKYVAPANAAAAPKSPAAGSLRSYCYTGETSGATDPYNTAGRRVFFTALAPVSRDAMRPELFRKYVEAKYGVLHDSYPACAGGNDPQNQMIHFVERDVANAKAAGSPVIMTEWTPDKHEALMAEAAKNPAPAPAAVTSPKKTPAPQLAEQSAYEKAMAAQRPQSVTQGQLAAVAKQAASAKAPETTAMSAPISSEKFMFCYTTGSPYRGTAQSHYYVTHVFPAPAANSRPYNKFAAYLKGQHRQEDISFPSCSTPGPRNTEESTRQSYIEVQRKFPNRAVVELDWTPED